MFSSQYVTYMLQSGTSDFCNLDCQQLRFKTFYQAVANAGPWQRSEQY